MKVFVLGGGVIGVTSAYYLAKQGVDVTVIERQHDVPEETSFGNAGQISPGYSTPWAAPGIPTRAIKWLFQKHAPFAIRPDGSSFQAQWMCQMLANCNDKSYATNKARMVRVAEYSRDCLQALRAETGISYEHRTGGNGRNLHRQCQCRRDPDGGIAPRGRDGLRRHGHVAAQRRGDHPAGRHRPDPSPSLQGHLRRHLHQDAGRLRGDRAVLRLRLDVTGLSDPSPATHHARHD